MSEDAISPGQAEKSDGASEGLVVSSPPPELVSEVGLIGVAVPREPSNGTG